MTLVGQDWGGLIGLRLAAENPDRFARVVAANTGLPTGDQPMPTVWWQFRRGGRDGAAAGRRPARAVRLPHAAAPDRCLAALRRAVPGRHVHRRPARHAATLCRPPPDDPATAANRAAWNVLRTSDTPLLVAFSDRDPITGSMAPLLKRTIPGAAGREHPVIKGAGHFLQEDAGPELGEIVADFVAS